MDTDDDGRVLAEELQGVLLATLREFDRDGDDQFNPQEVGSFNEELAQQKRKWRAHERREEKIRRALRQCAQPTIPAAAQLIDLQVSRGAALSTVTLTDDQAMTSVGDVEIEPGSTPLFLNIRTEIGGSDGLILRFSGAVDRVVGLSAQEDGVGVLGLPKEKIHTESDFGGESRRSSGDTSDL